MHDGRVAGEVSERGEIVCDHVILAAGLWSRPPLGNHGVALPVLPLICYAFRTTAIEDPGTIAVGGPSFSFRKPNDGAYVIPHRAALAAPIVLDHALLGLCSLPTLKQAWKIIRPIIGGPLLQDLKLARRWRSDQKSPFEAVRVMDPPPGAEINAQALEKIRAAWPALVKAQIAESREGTMDITPDSQPVPGPVARFPGRTLATGFSGHGFGTSPAAGHLAADLATGAVPLVDPAPYRLARF